MTQLVLSSNGHTDARLAKGLALIFDLDGVVVDSMPVHSEAWRIYLERHGIDAGEIAPLMHGRRNDEIVTALFGADLKPEENFRHGAAKESLFREMIGPFLARHLVPGVVEFLNRFAEAPTGLASNAEPANIDFILDGAGIRHHFDIVVDGHRVQRPKPHPDIYLFAAEQLGAAPRNCIVFEDSPTGIEAASQAGMRVIAVKTHPGVLPQVDLQISDFHDSNLEPWLFSREPLV